MNGVFYAVHAEMLLEQQFRESYKGVCEEKT
jgi:hypothetical protein